MTSVQQESTFEAKPHFHAWASALPGMICVSRKARNASFRGYTAAETATPVISSCACLGDKDQSNYYTAGVCRSKALTFAKPGETLDMILKAC